MFTGWRAFQVNAILDVLGLQSLSLASLRYYFMFDIVLEELIIAGLCEKLGLNCSDDEALMLEAGDQRRCEDENELNQATNVPKNINQSFYLPWLKRVLHILQKYHVI